MSDPFKQLEGEQLSSVTFAQDFIQLYFDGPGINVYMPMTVDAEGVAVPAGDTHFRNALCGQIAKIVQNVSFQESESLTLTFIDGSRIVISLRSDDYSGPEAIYAHGFRDAPMIVV